MTFFLQSSLLLWYFISLYLVANDKTLDLQVKITGEIINLLCIGFIATNLMNVQTDNPLYYIVGGLLLCWFLYFTPQDWNNAEYSKLEKYVYTGIDIITILYIFDSVLFNLLKVMQSNLNNTHMFLKLKGFLFGF